MNLDECKQNTLFISKQFLILVFLNILICLRCEVVVFGTKKFFDSKKDSKDEDINHRFDFQPVVILTVMMVMSKGVPPLPSYIRVLQ